MFKNRILAAVAAFSLAGGAIVGIAGPALADDESTPTEPPAVVVEETVVTEPPAVEEVVETPPIETPPATEPETTDPATEPATTEPTTEPATEPVTTEPTTTEPSTEESSESTPAETEESTAEEPPSEVIAPLTSLAKEAALDVQILAAYPIVNKVQFCHATGSDDNNPYVSIETAVQAFFNAGHDTHQNFEDIVPPFSYQLQGQTFDFDGLNWDDEGMAIYYNGCNEVVVQPGVATASVFIIAASCTMGEQLVLGTATNATWGPVTDPVGDDDYLVTATADAGNFFAGNLLFRVFVGELAGPDMSPDCDNTLEKKVQFCHATGSEQNPYNLLDTSVNAFFMAGHDTHQDFRDIVPPFSYLKQGEVIDFPGLNWDAAGQAFFENGCNPVLLLPTVSFTQFTCTADGSYTLGVAGGLNPALVTFTVNGTPDVLAGTYPATVGETTVTAEALLPNELSPAWVDPDTFVFAKPAASDCVTGGGGGGLAHTGSSVDMTGLFGLGGGLMVIGLVALILRRRTTTG